MLLKVQRLVFNSSLFKIVQTNVSERLLEEKKEKFRMVTFKKQLYYRRYVHWAAESVAMWGRKYQNHTAFWVVGVDDKTG